MEPETAPRPARGARGLWANLRFRRLLVGQTMSSFGDWLATIALLALVLDVSGSSTAVAGVLVLRLAPAAIAGPVATRLVERFDRQRTMLAMDAARAVMVAVLPLVRALWWLYLWSFLLEVASLVFLPARDSSIPDLADASDDDVALANGMVLATSYGMIPIGAGAFALLAALVRVGPGRFAPSATTLAFWIDAATFVASFVMIQRIPAFGGTSARVDEQHASGTHESPFLEAFRIPLVRALVLPATVAAVGIGSLFSLGIKFVRDVLGASNAQFGVLVVMFGVGAGLGLAVLHFLHVTGLRPVRYALGLQGAVIALMSLSPVVELAYLGAVLFGGAAAATLAGAMSVVQEDLEGHERVQAFTVFHVFIRGGLALAAIAAGAAADLVSTIHWPLIGRVAPVRLVLVLSGLVVLGTALAARGLGRRVVSARPAPRRDGTLAATD